MKPGCGIAINGRFLWHRTTGMQRYAGELVRRFGGDAESIRPSRPLFGGMGHAWEQVCLPVAARGKLLWSPNNTGPLAVANQVCTIHDLIPLDRPEWFNHRFTAFYSWLFPALVHRVAHIIAVSHFTKQRIMERFGVPDEKITVIWNGVEDRYRPAREADILSMREALGLGNRPYLLSVGSLEPRKNLSRLLAAWAMLKPTSGSDPQLVVAGMKGNAQVFSDARTGPVPPNVLFPGYVDERYLPALYSGALAAVYPSLYEGFGLPPLEAMACGTPVITSNVTSLPEVVGNAALLINPLDAYSIAAAMSKVIEDGELREDLIRKGFCRAALFSWDQTAAQTWALLRRHADAN
jgi:glycosyltransferase involved in cell wall biosynthesis